MASKTLLSDTCFCPCCERDVPGFRDWSADYRNVVCPICDSNPRHRLFWFFVKQQGLLRGADIRVLHFAPEGALRPLLSSLPNVRYSTADIERPDVDVLLDVRKLPCPDA